MSTYLRKTKLLYKISLLISLISLISCTNKQGMVLPDALPEPTRTQAEQSINSTQELSPPKQQIKPLKSADLSKIHLPKGTEEVLKLPKGLLTLNADNLPLSNFVHLALGEVLKIPFELDKDVASNTSPINLNISQGLPADQLLDLVEQILESFDIALVQREQTLRVIPKAKLSKLPAVLSLRGNAKGYGQIVEVIPLRYVTFGELITVAGSIFEGGKYGRINHNSRLNTVIAAGEAKHVKRFKDFVKFLDRSGFSQHQLRLVRPIYWQADELAKQVRRLLKVQGIPTSDDTKNSNAVVISAVKSMNALFITSPQKKWMQQAESLIKQLDNVDAAGPKVRTFIYFSQHRPADELGGLISKALGGSASQDSSTQSSDKVAGGNNQAATTDTASTAGANAYTANNLRVVVDNKRSALVLIGTPAAYQMVVPILKALDIPTRQVLIEITVADVTLDKSLNLGVEWQLDNIDIGKSLSTLGTAGGLAAVSGGLTYQLLDSSSGLTATVNALATAGDAKILSSPTLLAMDGETSHLQVGTQISVVTSEVSNSSSTNEDSAGLLRSFQYIDTGVILDISPTITEYGSIRLELKQEVSEPGAIVGDQPPIFKREVDTVVTANSGQTILIGGLITHNQSESVTKVPWLGDIPYLGALFRTTSESDRSTELIILITPHLIKDQYDAEELTQSFRDRLGW